MNLQDSNSSLNKCLSSFSLLTTCLLAFIFTFNSGVMAAARCYVPCINFSLKAPDFLLKVIQAVDSPLDHFLKWQEGSYPPPGAFQWFLGIPGQLVALGN